MTLNYPWGNKQTIHNLGLEKYLIARREFFVYRHIYMFQNFLLKYGIFYLVIKYLVILLDTDEFSQK